MGSFAYDETILRNLTQATENLVSENGDGNSPVVQWSGLHAFTAKGAGSIPGQGTKILQDMPGAAKKKKQLVMPLRGLQESPDP